MQKTGSAIINKKQPLFLQFLMKKREYRNAFTKENDKNQKGEKGREENRKGRDNI